MYSPHAQALLSKFYGGNEQFEKAAIAYSAGDSALAERITSYLSKKWMMLASPVLSNTEKGLPISCFKSYVADSIDGLVKHQSEFAYMSVSGGGVGGHWSDVRSPDSKSCGIIPFIKVLDSEQEAYRQGITRKGSYASFIDVTHPEIIEFLNLRTPSGGDHSRKCFNLNIGINITDDFMQAVQNNTTYDLICPKHGFKESISARYVWEQILETRVKTGEPYLIFIDTANRALNKQQKDMGLSIKGSNICSEIFLVTDEQRSAVCCLSSLNLELFDEWENTTIVEDMITFLDNVLQSFIERAPESLSKAVFSALEERSIGLGAMGWHSLLQRKKIPFESALAVGLNKKIFSLISDRAAAQSRLLGSTRGYSLNSEFRNLNRLAIAPNSNSSILLSTSPSIEPWISNHFVHRTRAGSFEERNPYLEQLLDKKGISFDSIIEHKGSVQHLSKDLNPYELATFKTAFEIDQRWIVQHAADRQPYICQGQSVNLFFGKGTSRAYLNQVHLEAWKSGLKSLYYCRIDPQTTAPITKNTSCVACEG